MSRQPQPPQGALNNIRAMLRQQLSTAGRQIANSLHVVDDLHQTDIILDQTYLNGKKVIKLVNATECTFNIPAANTAGAADPTRRRERITKVFVDGCKGCIFNFEDTLITQHVEMIHCEDVTINIHAKLLTLQVDLSQNVVVNYSQQLFDEHTRIIHAGVQTLQVNTFEGAEHKVSYDHLIHLENCKTEMDNDLAAEERQFMTCLDRRGGLTTKRVIKRKGHLIPSDIREAEHEGELSPSAEGGQTSTEQGSHAKSGRNAPHDL